jgi:DGQHR domain-containing protein
MNNINKIEGKIVKQNSQEFILGIFTIEQILKFTKYTERLIVGFDDEENKPIYNSHIQRTVEKIRVEKIADFLINDPLAIFPTNIVLGIPSSVIESQITDDNNVTIYLDEKVYSEMEKARGDVYITIIDGQHRIRGIEIAIERLTQEINLWLSTIMLSDSHESQKKLKQAQDRLSDLEKIELTVSFFIDPTLEYQAMIFSTINRTQKRVSQNLVNSLFGLDSRDTPQKTALEITLALNSHIKSPFYKRIMLYGSYEKHQSSPISQATMVRSIINYICENSREAENDRYRKREDLFKRHGNLNKFLPFRKFYATCKDFVISDIIFFFFNAVRSTFINEQGVSYWDLNSKNEPSNILQTTVGYEALMKILNEILEKKLPAEIQLLDKEFYISFLKKAKNINFADQSKYPFSTKGKNILYLELSLAIFPDLQDGNDNRRERLEDALNE